MPSIKPTKRKKLIRNLKNLGFDGPYAGGNHQYMVKGQRKLWIPNPHSGDISAPFLLNYALTLPTETFQVYPARPIVDTAQI